MATKKKHPGKQHTMLKERLHVSASGDWHGKTRLSSCRKNVLITDVEHIQQAIRDCVQSITPDAMRLNVSLDGLEKKSRCRALASLAQAILKGDLKPDTEVLTELAKNGNVFTVTEVRRLLSGLKWFNTLKERLGELICEWISLHKQAGEKNVIIPSEFKCSVTPRMLYRQTVKALLDNDVGDLADMLESEEDNEPDDHPVKWFDDDSEGNDVDTNESPENED